MRILAVADYYRHGTARVVEERASLLARRGHQVVLLAGAETRELEVQARAARLAGLQPALVPHAPADRGLRPLLRLRAAYRRAFEECCAEGLFDAIVFNQPLSAWGVLSSPRSRRSATLYTFHSPWAAEWAIASGLDSSSPRGALARVQFAARRWIERRAVRSCRGLTVLSEYMRAQLLRTHPAVRPARVRLVPGGVDLQRFRPLSPAARAARKAALGFPARAPLALTVRRLVPRMGLENLLLAFRRLLAEFPDLRLAVGGAGPLEGALRARSRALGLGPRVRFLGFVPEEDLPALYGAADLFVLPTAQLEGFGLVTLEALASGTLVVGTPVGATPEILGPIEPRLLARDPGPEGLRAAMAAVLSLDPVERHELAAHAARRVALLYDRERVGDALEDLLGRLVVGDLPEDPGRHRPARAGRGLTRRLRKEPGSLPAGAGRGLAGSIR